MSSIFPRQMYKVHYSLRSLNELAYEPLLVSIGPYHHGTKVRYEDMEKRKELYLQKLINISNQNVEEMITPEYLEKEMGNMEAEIRKCYASSYGPFESEEFCRMMVLDGCFIIELLQRLDPESCTLDNDDESDHVAKISCILGQVCRDLILFENQLPLFVLEKLFVLVKKSEDETDFVDLALRKLLRKPDVERKLEYCTHLLGLAYAADVGLPLPDTSSHENNNYSSGECEDIRSATELHEAGVQFKLSNAGFGSIKFENGTLELPYLKIEDHTESLLRNYIAYEQYSERVSLHRFVDYIIFLDCLINTARDVEFLRHAGIVSNGLGAGDKASEMVNRLSLSVTYDSNTLYYAREFRDVNQFCARKWNFWVAKLKRKFFNSPWSYLSALAALALLLLTVTQTVFSVLSYASSRS